MIISQVSGKGGGRVHVYLTCRETAGTLKVFSVMIKSQVSGKGGGRVYVYLTRYVEKQQDLACCPSVHSASFEGIQCDDIISSFWNGGWEGICLPDM